jgi:hypothetical protein
MPTTHSIDDLKHYHQEASKLFAAELIILKEVIPKITEDRLAKTATLLISCGQTGAALLQLANQIDNFSSESVMLGRAFIEKITNFCYANICDEKEYRKFLLHPVYKHYHNVGFPKMEDNLAYMPDNIEAVKENIAALKEKQEKLKIIPIVQEALTLFSEEKANLNWTKKSLNERIEAIEKWGKLLDVFFTLNKLRYYSDASETLHGSLYGCTYGLGIFEPGFFNQFNEEELQKRSYKDSSAMLLHLGTLIHESLTLISYQCDIKKIWEASYQNRNHALSLLYNVLEIKYSKQKKI